MVFPRPEAREKGGWRGGWPTARGTSGRWDRRGRRRSTGERRRGGQRGRGLLRPCRALGKLEMGREVAVPEKSRSRLRVNGAILHPGGPGGPGGPGEVATSLNSLFRSVAPLGRSWRHLYSCIAIGKLETKHNDDDSLPHLPHLLGTRGRRWAKRFTLKFRKNPQRRAIPVPPFYKLEAVKILRSVSWSVLESRLNLSL